MVFSSLIFLFGFLPVTIALYYLSPVRARNAVFVLASLVFYIWGAGHEIVLLLSISVVDYFIGWRMYRESDPKKKKCWLVASLTFNLSLLAYFKYANFFVLSWNLSVPDAVHLTHWTDVVLPLGISFYTFETMSYVIDIYRGQQKPARTVLEYALYISLFPHLIAGPIYRFREIERELDEELRARETTVDMVLMGVWQFSLGLAKKVIIANSVGRIADYCFDSTADLSTFEYWVGSISYAFQIYFDFSGYSEMAVGLGKMFGFHLPPNFDMPYVSQSVTEFWRRWHMTLSRWFRDYLYIPLGGNRAGKFQTLRNLVIVFFLCGLWHGGKWTFVVWGLYHGCLLMAERAGLGRLLEKAPFLGRLYTAFAVLIGWVIFRGDSLASAVHIMDRMFLHLSFSAPSGYFLDLTAVSREFWVCFFLASLSLTRFRFETLIPRSSAVRLAYTMASSVLLLLWCAGSLATDTFNPFIYYRF